MIYHFLFALALFVGLIAWAFSIFESASTVFFKEKAFVFGIPVFQEYKEIIVGEEKLEVGRIYEVDEGKYKFINKNTCLFHAKTRLLDSVSTFSLLPVKGIVRLDHGGANVVARLPVGQTIFIICFFSALAAGTGLVPSDANGRIAIILMMIACLVVGCWVFRYSVNSLKKRSKLIAEIITNHISNQRT